MASLSNRSIRYLTSCYEADQRDSSVLDLFHASVHRRFVFPDEELVLQGVLATLALPQKVGTLFAKEAAIYRRERRLIYAAPFLVGMAFDPSGNERRVCGPLYTFDAVVEADSVGSTSEVIYRVRVELHSKQINAPLLLCVAPIVKDTDPDDRERFESWLRRAPMPPFDGPALTELVHWLGERVVGAELDALYRLPKLDSEKALSRESKAASETLKAVPAAALALVENSPASQGSLFELREIGNRERLSAPLTALFSDTTDDPEASSDRDSSSSFASVPTRLSSAQEKVLRSAVENPLSLIVGPPGTGKSFSVAALAVDQIARNRSVLIACRSDQALNVIADKLELMLRGSTLVLRGGSSKSHRRLKRYLEALLGGELDEELAAAGDPSHFEPQLETSLRELSLIERYYRKRVSLERRWGALRGRQLGILGKLKRAWLELWLKSTETPKVLQRELTRRDAERMELASSLLWASVATRLRRALVEHRVDLARFLGAMRARTSSRQEEFFDEVDFSVLLASFPLWMVTFRDLHRVVPLEPELFDLVIVDEATQCDMASPIPALFRASRAALTGDPKQLSHVSFLSRARQANLGQQLGLDERTCTDLDYRGKSLLHRVHERLTSQDQVGFLREHYRSMPQIIQFSNQEFYGNRLRIMTSRPETLSRAAVELRPVSGKRASNGVNRQEADAVVEEIEKLVREQATLSGGASHSIGVLSPFRAQVDFLGERLSETLEPATIEKHSLRVGTAHSFQGDERDVMFLSLVLDADAHSASFRYLNQPEVFNVSITRARDKQIVFFSLDDDGWNRDSLLGRYLSAMSKPRPSVGVSQKARDRFVEEVAQAAATAGFRAWPEFPVAGTTIDLLLEKNGLSMGVDLVGFPSPAGDSLDQERMYMFQRAGLPVASLSYFDWCLSSRACVEELSSRFSEIGDGAVAGPRRVERLVEEPVGNDTQGSTPDE